MEVKIFHLPTVGGLLRRGYVEARLHNDDHQHPEVVERVKQLQKELAGSSATPYYLILDPATRAKLGVFEGPDLRGGDFERFLRRALP